ncbi:toll/interleukin-1 receptor domain-containing protein, partial [bacterium]|nr:toll/interleukin-1 receptor domain-containing protein [bacterium]
MTGIFISYSRKDSAVARKLMQEFKTINLDVWVDWEDIPPAVGWLDQILQGIERADAFMFLVSPDSAISEVAITIDIEWVQEHRRLQVRALEWDRKKDASLLLRGGDLKRARQMISSAEKNDPKPSDLQKIFIEYSQKDESRKTTLWILAASA